MNFCCFLEWPRNLLMNSHSLPTGMWLTHCSLRHNELDVMRYLTIVFFHPKLACKSLVILLFYSVTVLWPLAWWRDSDTITVYIISETWTVNCRDEASANILACDFGRSLVCAQVCLFLGSLLNEECNTRIFFILMRSIPLCSVITISCKPVNKYNQFLLQYYASIMLQLWQHVSALQGAIFRPNSTGLTVMK
jgi:hypothetical protein